MKIYILALLTLCISSQLSAQVKIGDNPTTIDTRSLLELESSDKAFMLPRLTTVQRDAQTGWKAGHTIYNSTDSCIQTFDGVVWECLGAATADLDEWNDADSNLATLGKNLIYARQALGNSDTVVVTDDGKLGIGLSNPSAGIHLRGQSGTAINNAFYDAVGGEHFLIQRRANGTIGSETPLLNGDFIVQNIISGHNGVGYSGFGGVNLWANATENWNATSQGAKYSIATTPNGSLTRITRLVIEQDGNVGFGLFTSASVPTAKIHVKPTASGDALRVEGVQNYADNAAAVAAGLPVGTVYRTGDLLKIVH